MAADKKRQPDEPEDLGFEVVENVPAAAPKPRRSLPTAKLLPPLPPAKASAPVPAPAARKATVKPVDEDPGFEVVESTPAKSPPTKSGSRPKVAVIAEDDEDDVLPARKSRRAMTEDDEDDDQPSKKTKKKGKKGKKGGTASGANDEAQNALMEWGAPLFMILVGLVLTCVGTYGIAKHPDYGINPMVMILFRVIGECISIPITVVALIFIGSLFGIEYGTILSAIRNLAGMGFLIGGLMDIFDWSGLPFFVYQPIIFLIGMGLFMTLFHLDTFETLITMFMLNILSWIFQFLVLILIVAMLVSGSRTLDKDTDLIEDPDEDAIPALKDQQKRGGTSPFQKKGNQNRPKNPNDDDDDQDDE